MPAHGRNNRTPDGAKRRWTADDRARRTAAPTRGRTQRADDTGRAARRAAEFGEGGGSRERRPDWFPGGRTADDARGRRGRDERADRRRGDRPVRGRH
ncbi:hypothetical protein ACFSBI_03705, partial [Amnibacterium endophyticum]